MNQNDNKQKEKTTTKQTMGRTSHGMADREWSRELWDSNEKASELEDTCTSIRSEKRTILAPCLRTSQKLLGSD